MGKRGAKKLTNTQGGGPNLKSVLRHDHLKNLALWSSAGDTPIPSLASLFGRRLAADIDSTGIATDPDLVSCQRCEIILKPGFNCNVRIEKVSSKQNQRRTAKGQMKEIYPFKPKAPRPKINQEMTVMPQISKCCGLTSITLRASFVPITTLKPRFLFNIPHNHHIDFCKSPLFKFRRTYAQNDESSSTGGGNRPVSSDDSTKKDQFGGFSFKWRELLNPDQDNFVAVALAGVLTWASLQVLSQLFFKYSFIAALLIFILVTLL
ncbi:PREDICTED: uncharacterized protein LOC104720941 [Camelina sativa]|uniref:Uncharacterized protein LOC104720941 n=1 Tax=Camelina sativa TaxID=90675 RepID=A0ABM1QKH7_CAMSA|nr:PREDICTED: uncharacterized protein LOC104720941 [Camelina sativa]